MEGQDSIEIRERLKGVEVLQSKSIEEAHNWRVLFCGKIDKILETMQKLPCTKREGWYSAINRQLAFMWVVITAVVLILLKAAFAK